MAGGLWGRLPEIAGAWDAFTRTWRWRALGVGGGVAAAVALLALGPPAGMAEPAWRVAVVALVMAAWWLLAVLPMAITALVPLVAFPVLGVAGMAEVGASYGHPLLFLLVGGFVLGHAMEEAGLHRRLTAWLLAPEAVRRSPRRVLLALMTAAGLVSAVVSNTATMLMMLPLAMGLAQACGGSGRQQSAFPLGLAYACSIGGMATLVGTPSNAVLVGVAAKNFDAEVSFAQWFLVGAPAALALLPVAWASVCATLDVPRVVDAPVRVPEVGPWRGAERAVLAALIGAMTAWVGRAPVQVAGISYPGWGPSTGLPGSEADTLVALVVGFVLFLVPVPGGPGGERRPLVTWDRFEASVPWSVILLIGGGFALADAIEASGLTASVAAALAGLGRAPTAVAVLAVCLVVTFLTEVTSNTATTQVVVPVLGAVAMQSGIDPLLWTVPATISASCAFMMPVGTAPNAIATEAGRVAPADMAIAGWWLNLAGAGVIAALSLALVPLVFG